jgi:sugar diacid utilization regulator
MDKLDAKMIVIYARSNMNSREVCRKLHYGNSTVWYHFDRIRKITGLDPRNFFNLHELYSIACNILGDEADEI